MFYIHPVVVFEKSFGKSDEESSPCFKITFCMPIAKSGICCCVCRFLSLIGFVTPLSRSNLNLETFSEQRTQSQSDCTRMVELPSRFLYLKLSLLFFTCKSYLTFLGYITFRFVERERHFSFPVRFSISQPCTKKIKIAREAKIALSIAISSKKPWTSNVAKIVERVSSSTSNATNSGDTESTISEARPDTRKKNRRVVIYHHHHYCHYR